LLNFAAAYETLAARRQVALTVVGVAGRQVETAVDTAVDTTVEAVEVTRGQASTPEPPSKAEPPRREARPDRRGYEERSIEELPERARELELEGRSSMSRDELIAALRKQSR
jgi:Rho termination factor, N-terminal domain